MSASSNQAYVISSTHYDLPQLACRISEAKFGKIILIGDDDQLRILIEQGGAVVEVRSNDAEVPNGAFVYLSHARLHIQGQSMHSHPLAELPRWCMAI